MRQWIHYTAKIYSNIILNHFPNLLSHFHKIPPNRRNFLSLFYLYFPTQIHILLFSIILLFHPNIMTNSFNLITRKEWKYYVGKILENNVSSFGKTEKECIEKTKEALNLYIENAPKTQHISIKSPRLLQLEYNYA